MSEPVFCGMDECNSEATRLTSNGMPLCASHAEAYELGQCNPDTPLKEIDEE